MITAVLNNKGGVAKTTTAVNLAAGLAEHGYRTLLVDLDSQASASLHLGVSRAALTPSLAEVFNSQTSLERAVRPLQESLSLVTGSVELSHFDLDMAARDQREFLLKNLLNSVSGFDRIVLDCPPSLSLMTINALVAAEDYLVPVCPNYLALEGLAQLLRGVDAIQKRSGRVASLLGILLTRVDRRTRLSHEIIAMMRQHFGTRMLDTEIRNNVKLAEASSHGQSIFDYAPRSRGALDYDDLVLEVQQRWSKQTAA